MKQYDQLAEEFNFTVIDATRDVHTMQSEVRELISRTIDLSRYRSRVPR